MWVAKFSLILCAWLSTCQIRTENRLHIIYAQGNIIKPIYNYYTVITSVAIIHLTSNELDDLSETESEAQKRQ